MAEVWTTAELLVSIREDGRISSDDPDGSDAALLRAADREIARRFVPMIRKARADYNMAFVDYLIVADQDEYPIPPRATTSSIRTVVVTNSQYEVQRQLSPCPMEDKFDFAGGAGLPSRYVIEDDRLIVLPRPSSAEGYLRVYFELRPSTLVAVTEAARTTSTTSDATQILVTMTDPAYDAGDWDDAPIDIIKGTSPFSLAVRDCPVAQLDSFGSDLLIITRSSWDHPPNTGAGDWVCNAGETVIPQLPPELHPFLAMAVAARYLKPIDPDSANDLLAELNAGLAEFMPILSPRKQGIQTKLRPRSSNLRRGARRRGTWDDFGGG